MSELQRQSSFLPCKTTTTLWESAITAHDDVGDCEESLRFFRQMPADSARISFNIGSVHMSERSYGEAIEEYSKALDRDSHLAIAAFQRALAHHNMGSNEDDEDALQDFIECHRLLRGNLLIDYRELGLKHILWEYQVLFNLAVVYVQLGLNRHADQYYAKAKISHAKAKEVAITKEVSLETALRNLNSICQCPCGNPSLSVNVDRRLTPFLCQLKQLEVAPFFHPRGLSTVHLEAVKKQQFLGKPKLLFSTSRQDIYRKSSTGFTGAVVSLALLQNALWP
eukprot:scpid89251/ scgid1207/ Neutrophil cytosol factor 2; 67 kDa neutrophil oxidase factor; Neutrophil NADPH oxidase factor 2; p67-phox